MMLVEDNAIKYQAKLKQVKSYIDRLEELGLDTTKIKGLVSRIDEEANNMIAENYSKFAKTVLLEDSLKVDYSSSIRKIDEVIKELDEEWNTYFKIHNTCLSIKVKLKEVNEQNIYDIVNEAIGVLKSLEYSSTISYDVEKRFVDETYQTIYQVLQAEAAYSCVSSLFGCVKESETHSIHICELLDKDLSKIKHKDIRAVYDELQTKGLSITNYMDKRLFFLMALYHNPDIVSANTKMFLEKANAALEKKEKYDDLVEKETNLSEYNETHLSRIKEIKKKIRKHGLLSFLNIALVSSIIAGGFFISRKATRDNAKEYYTITQTYDSVTGETTSTEGYAGGKKEKMKITEYTPWVEPTIFKEEKYTRSKRSFDVSSEDIHLYNNLEDYLNEDVANHFSDDYSRYGPRDESQKELPEDYGYVGRKYVIERTTKDLDNFQYKENPYGWIGWTIVIAVAAVLLDLGGYAAIRENSNDDTIFEYIKAKKRETKDLKENMDYLLGARERLEYLESSTIATAKSALDVYNNLPSDVQQSAEVAKLYEKLK